SSTPRPSSTSSSVYSPGASIEQPAPLQWLHQNSAPDQIFLQPSRVYANDSNLSGQKYTPREPLHLVTPPRRSSLRPWTEDQLTPASEIGIASPGKSQTVKFSTPWTDKVDPFLTPNYMPPMERPMSFSSQGHFTSGAFTAKLNGASDVEERPISRWSDDSSDDGDQPLFRESLLGYLSKLAGNRRSRSDTPTPERPAAAHSKSFSSAVSSDYQADVDERKRRLSFPHFSLAKRFQTQGPADGGFNSANNLNRMMSSEPTDRRPSTTGSSIPSAAGKALTGIRKGASQVKTSIASTRQRMANSRAERRRANLKKKIVVIGEVCQSPDGEDSHWV
ncbi:MAG: hypothetical protein M1826_004567, partial [Phylliscum demangeonii]